MSRHGGALFMVVLMAWSMSCALGQVTPTSDVGFTTIGYITAANVVHHNTASPLAVAGGTVIVDGINHTIPDGTICTLPANTAIWSELFDPVTGGFKALRGEATLVGNIVNGVYIVGLCSISPEFLMAGQGFVSAINATDGSLTVGGATVRLNDPLGMYGAVATPEPLWGVDPANPSVRTPTGYPHCIPSAGAPWCTPNVPGPGAIVPDTTKFLPLKVKDYVTFTGYRDSTTGIVWVWGLVSNTDARTNGDVGFVAIESINDGVGGTTATSSPFCSPNCIITKATKVVGFVTDNTCLVDIYAIDTDPCNASLPVFRQLTTGISPRLKAPLGRFTWVVNAIGLDDNPFLPAARNFQVRLSNCGAAFNASNPHQTLSPNPNAGPTGSRNSILASQYQAPVSAYTFPEVGAVGDPIPAWNFGDFPYVLRPTDYTGSDPAHPIATVPGNSIGPLFPWPNSGTPSAPWTPVKLPPCVVAAPPPVAPAVAPAPCASQDKFLPHVGNTGTFGTLNNAQAQWVVNAQMASTGLGGVTTTCTTAITVQITSPALPGTFLMTPLGGNQWTVVSRITVKPVLALLTASGCCQNTTTAVSFGGGKGRRRRFE